MTDENHTTNTKCCTKCGETKSLDKFEKHRRQCRTCRNSYANSLPSTIERTKKYWKANKDKSRANQRRWYKKAKEAGLIPKGNHRKRAIKHGAPYESVSPEKVFARDGWKCQICGKATPVERRGTRYSNAPELDHRIPISLGGPHTYLNCQCACRECNTTKSNRNTAGQYPLFAA